MIELLEKLEELKFRIRKLAERNGLLERENRDLKKELEEAVKKIEEQQIMTGKLERQIQFKNIATTIKSDKATKETNERIEHLVREIDKCMALFRK